MKLGLLEDYPMRRRGHPIVPILVLSALLMNWGVALGAQAGPVVPPDVPLMTIWRLASTHAWLPLAIALTVYVRHLLSDESKLPVTIPARWLPSVTAATSLAFTVLVGLQAGASWGVALLGGFTMAVAMGFFDGLVVGLFGSDPAKVPWYARLVLLLVDDVGRGGGKSRGGDTLPPTLTSLPRPPMASRVFRTSPIPVHTRLDRPLWMRRMGGVLAIATAPLLLATMTRCAPGGGAPPISPQAQAVTQAAIVLGACIESVYASDSQKIPAPSPLQIALDEGVLCGADVGNLVTVLGGGPSPSRQAVAKAAEEHAAEVRAAGATYRSAHPTAGGS